MALINCPECGKEISDSVKKCPHCGKKIKDNPFKQFIFKHKILFGLFIIFCVLATGIGVYIGTHEFLSYEEYAVLTALDHVKDSSAYKDSVHIKNVSVAYCTPEKIKMVDGASGSGHGSFGGGLAKQSYIKTTPVKFQKMASYFIFDKEYYYKITSEDKIEPVFSVTDYSGYDYMDDDNKVLIKDLVVPIQLNKNGTITVLNEYNWTLTKE